MHVRSAQPDCSLTVTSVPVCTFVQLNLTVCSSYTSVPCVSGRDAIMIWKDGKGKSMIRRKDLTFHKELGVGMSGNVYLGKVANTNTTCCVKVRPARYWE